MEEDRRHRLHDDSDDEDVEEEVTANEKEDPQKEFEYTNFVGTCATDEFTKLKLTKVAIRRLPPEFTLEEILELLGPLPPYNYLYFSEPEDNPEFDICSRPTLRINFEDSADADWFVEKYNGYEILDMQGNEWKTITEYCPSQILPVKKNNINDLEGSYDPEEDFELIEELYGGVDVEFTTTDDMVKDIEEKKASKASENAKITPLLESIIQAERDRVDKLNKLIEEERKIKNEQIASASSRRQDRDRDRRDEVSDKNRRSTTDKRRDRDRDRDRPYRPSRRERRREKRREVMEARRKEYQQDKNQDREEKIPRRGSFDNDNNDNGGQNDAKVTKDVKVTYPSILAKDGSTRQKEPTAQARAAVEPEPVQETKSTSTTTNEASTSNEQKEKNSNSADSKVKAENTYKKDENKFKAGSTTSSRVFTRGGGGGGRYDRDTRERRYYDDDRDNYRDDYRDRDRNRRRGGNNYNYRDKDKERKDEKQPSNKWNESASKPGPKSTQNQSKDKLDETPSTSTSQSVTVKPKASSDSTENRKSVENLGKSAASESDTQAQKEKPAVGGSVIKKKFVKRYVKKSSNDEDKHDSPSNKGEVVENKRTNTNTNTTTVEGAHGSGDGKNDSENGPAIRKKVVKIIRVVKRKVTPPRPSEGGGNYDGNYSEAKKVVEKPSASTTTKSSNDNDSKEKDQDKKPREEDTKPNNRYRNRPDAPIYRPGSLRASNATSTTPTTSNINKDDNSSSTSKEKEKK